MPKSTVYAKYLIQLTPVEQRYVETLAAKSTLLPADYIRGLLGLPPVDSLEPEASRVARARALCEDMGIAPSALGVPEPLAGAKVNTEINRALRMLGYRDRVLPEGLEKK
ncbi:MAG: hypothetical protein ACO29C_06440 [Fluviibacter sp.]